MWSATSMRSLVALLTLALMLESAHAYDVTMHEDFHALAFGSSQRSVAIATPADLERFRLFLYERTAWSFELRSRWPTPASFDARAMKELLALSPSASILAIDFVTPGERASELSVWRTGAAACDRD